MVQTENFPSFAIFHSDFTLYGLLVPCFSKEYQNNDLPLCREADPSPLNMIHNGLLPLTSRRNADKEEVPNDDENP